jgi:predicted alpha-1,2-mannosidase
VKIAKETSRRQFLKSAGAGVALVALSQAEQKAAAEETAGGTRKHLRGTVNAVHEKASTRLQRVNLLQGTNSTRAFSRGNTLPIAAMPFGMAHWTLQSSVAQTPWFFRPEDQRIEGLRCTHQLSPWLSDYGYATFLPFSGETGFTPEARASSYARKDAVLLPHRLQLDLLRYRCRFELTPTERGALLRMRFKDRGSAGLIVDLPGEDAEFVDLRENRILAGGTHANEGGVPAGFTAHYVLKFDVPIKACEIRKADGRRIAVVRFDVPADGAVQCWVATSFLSREQAMTNLRRELEGKSFDALCTAAEKVWKAELSRIEVSGGSEEQRRIFDSCMYRAFLYPRMFHEYDADGNAVHYSAYSGQPAKGVMYADHGYWDTYRAWYSLMSIVNPARLGEILQGWVNAAKDGGWLPQFPAPGYRSCMTGSLIDSVFGDAAAKNLGGYDTASAYAALYKHAMQVGNPDRGYGRRGIEDYVKRGYVPSDKVAQAAVETLDSSYGDFCIAQVARSLGKESDAALFEQRAQNWRNVWDAKTRFPRGKTSAGAWVEPFDPFAWGGAYVEGAAWQHRFSVPHDVPGLMEAMGGRALFVDALEEMLRTEPRFGVGTYGFEIHEMSEMAAVNFGQYAHSNQPVHHVLYLFALAGRRDRTQYWVHRVLNELYTVQDFPGDEDTGSMAAWYILSALGLYQVCPGKADYVVGAPLFDEATIRFETGRSTTIRARNSSEKNFYAGAPFVNGKVHTGAEIAHKTIVDGCEMVFEKSAQAKA